MGASQQNSGEDMKLKGVIFEDFVNYCKPSMILEFPICDFKCDKECSKQICQNSLLAQSPNIEVDIDSLIRRYEEDPISEAIICQGLEPFDSWNDLIDFLNKFRKISNDDFVIYTGYKEEEIQDRIEVLQKYKNIIVKFGRFIPNRPSHYDDILGLKLASDNQYAKIISKKD